MRKLTPYLVLSVLVVASTGVALAAGPSSPTNTDPVWRASYWNNTSMTGAPALARDEIDLYHDWGAGSPHPSVNADHFSARWTRNFNTTAGIYRFTATSDDGIRVWLDNELVIDAWYDHPVRTFETERYLESGQRWVTVEYYENSGLAAAKVTWIPVGTPPSFVGWRGEYWNNGSLSGAPALVREDASINFDWGYGSPAPSVVAADDFSVRWTRTVSLPAGRYRFVARVDDGVRLWVNSHLLIDAWQVQSVSVYEATIDLPGGAVPITIEYFEKTEKAVAQLSWSVAPQTLCQTWHGEYFNNGSLGGAPSVVRGDTQINFDWGYGSPAPGAIGVDYFSARWTQTVNLPADRYRFELTVDDGARLWVNDRLLIDAWRVQTATVYYAEIDLPGGATHIKLEYFENREVAVARLFCRAGMAGGGTAPGTVIVDDTDPGFVKEGSPTGWRVAYEGYGGRLTWTRNNDWERPYFNFARWFPRLSAGRYEVFVYIPYRYTTTASARYGVSHASGLSQRTVSQSAMGDRWVSLGTYWFNGADNEYVSLTDATGEARLSRLIAFDAVKWVPR